MATVDILLVLVVILFIVLIVRGPKMLPQLGEAFGKTVKGVRDNVPGAVKGDAEEGTDATNGPDDKPAT